MPAAEGIALPPGIDSQAISASTKPLHDQGKLKSPCLSMVGAVRSTYLHSFYSNGWIYSFGSCLNNFIKRKHILSKKLKKLLGPRGHLIAEILLG